MFTAAAESSEASGSTQVVNERQTMATAEWEGVRVLSWERKREHTADGERKYHLHCALQQCTVKGRVAVISQVPQDMDAIFENPWQPSLKPVLPRRLRGLFLGNRILAAVG